jgi:hypothetical protein
MSPDDAVPNKVGLGSGASVQVRLDEGDFRKLESLANDLGCHRASVLRLLLRQCREVRVHVEGMS